MKALRVAAIISAFALSTLASPELLSASSVDAYSDSGVSAFSRGGAWLATASDPMATFYNPAALATQPSSASAGFSLAFQQICFERLGADGQPTSFRNDPLAPRYGRTCNANAGEPSFLPNFATSFRVSQSFAVGIALFTPSDFPSAEWPASVRGSTLSGRQRPIPAGGRYLSLDSERSMVWATLGAGLALTEELRLGMAAVAGIANIEAGFMSMMTADSTNRVDDARGDVRTRIFARDAFVPGFVVSAHWSLTKTFEAAAWYRYSDAIRAHGDVATSAPFYDADGQVLPSCSVGSVDPCSEHTGSEASFGSNRVQVKRNVPMEARLGIRLRIPRNAASALELERWRKDSHPTRDPLRDDKFDFELDLTWADNSAFDSFDVLLPGPLRAGTSVMPTRLQMPTGYHDSFGVRVGGQYNAVPNLFGLRVGTSLETPATDAAHLSIMTVPALRGGFGGGFVARVSAIDLEMGYQHLWNAGFDNGGQGELKAFAFAGGADQRSFHAVNGGRVSQHGNVFAAGGVLRF